MIGDWIQSFGEPHKIIGIRTDTPYPYIKTNMSDTWYEWGMKDLADGIPLTPEIMEKNGMSMNPYGEYFAEDKNYFLELSREDEGFFWTINFNEYTIIPLNYVHELQHALRLCGIDKEITL